MINNNTIYLDITEEIYNNSDRFKQWLVNQKSSMNRNSSKIMFIIEGDRDSIKFSLIKNNYNAMDLNVTTYSGNKLKARRIQMNNIENIVEEIKRLHIHYKGVSLVEI